MHVCPDGWVYVGSTGKDPQRRWRKGQGYNNQKDFYASILKYGWDNIQHVIVGQYEDKKQAHIKERELTLANRDHCYNIKNTSNTYNAVFHDKIYWN